MHALSRLRLAVRLAVQPWGPSTFLPLVGETQQATWVYVAVRVRRDACV